MMKKKYSLINEVYENHSTPIFLMIDAYNYVIGNKIKTNSDVITDIKKSGIELVYKSDLHDSKGTPVSGSSYVSPRDNKPVIEINDSLPLEHQYFSLYHELAHIRYHWNENPLPFLNEKQEEEANIFASFVFGNIKENENATIEELIEHNPEMSELFIQLFKVIKISPQLPIIGFVFRIVLFIYKLPIIGKIFDYIFFIFMRLFGKHIFTYGLVNE